MAKISHNCVIKDVFTCGAADRSISHQLSSSTSSSSSFFCHFALNRVIAPCSMHRAQFWNLGWSFLASKVPSDTPYLSPWCTDLSGIWYTFNLTQVTKCIKIFAKLKHQELTYGVSDGSSVTELLRPKKTNLN